jgi:hypothetical protein
MSGRRRLLLAMTLVVAVVVVIGGLFVFRNQGAAPVRGVCSAGCSFRSIRFLRCWAKETSDACVDALRQAREKREAAATDG